MVQPLPASRHLQLATLPDRHVAVAVIVAEDGRYLLQLRDDRPDVRFPGHWALFGGGIEPGESPLAAVRRELSEELGFEPREAIPLAEAAHLVGPRGEVMQMHFFLVPVTQAEIDRMVQTEGAGKGLFTVEEAMRLERIAPWDLCAVMLHARRTALFGGGE
jgi:8-oxo-dGTP pyrophosphatase MutT (NUDIX family)